MAQTKLKNAQLPDVIQSKTIDTSNDIDTTTTKLTITGGTNGQVLSTDGSGNLSWTTAGGGGGGLGAPTYVATKTADETVTNSSTLQDDDHLFWDGFTSGKSYWIELDLLHSQANTGAAGQLKYGFSGNSNGFISNPRDLAAILCDGTASAIINNGTVANIPRGTKLTCSLKASANFTGVFRFAQTAASGNGFTIQTGSRMLIWEVA